MSFGRTERLGAEGRRLLEIGAAIRQTFEPVIMTHLYPRSEIAIHVQVLSADGGEGDYSMHFSHTKTRYPAHGDQRDDARSHRRGYIPP